MTRAINILASYHSPPTAGAVRDALAEVEGVKLDLRNGGIGAMRNHLAAIRTSDILLVELDLGDDGELSALTELIDALPRRVPVIATAADVSVDRVRLLMRLGVADFVPQPVVKEDLLNSILVAARQIAAEDVGPPTGGRVISFIRPSGGMGATTLAVQATYSLANTAPRNRKVCLIDLDLQGGNAGLYLDIDSSVSVLDCLEDPERMDASLLKSVVTKHRAGFDVMPAPAELVPVDGVSPIAIKAMLEVARAEYDVVIIDTPPVWNAWTDALLASSDAIVVVTQCTVAGVRQARRQLGLLVDRHLGQMPTFIIANRASTGLFRSGITARQAEQALGRRFDGSVPSDFKTISKAINEGIAVPEVRRRTRFEKEVRKLTRAVMEKIAPEAAASGRTKG